MILVFIAYKIIRCEGWQGNTYLSFETKLPTLSRSAVLQNIHNLLS